MSAIATWMGSMLTEPLVREVMRTLRDTRRQRLSEKELHAQLRATIAQEVSRIITAEISVRRDVLVAELRGESRLQRSWRPVVALTAFFSYWFVIIAYPFLLAWGLLPQVRFGEAGLQNMFWLTTITVGGYIGGRTLEKLFATVRAST